MREPKIWCVNFDNDADAVLPYGLESNLWLMQYQYAHNGQTYQGGRKKKGRTTRIWRRLGEINVGDFLVAYIKPKRFFAIGKVRTPRKAWTQKGSIESVTQAHRHYNEEGVVWYTDVFYEDFTDKFERQIVNPESGEPEVWRYNQRIDVEKWEYCVDGGVTVEGMGSDPDNQNAVFQIPDETFFEKIKTALREKRTSRLLEAADWQGEFSQQIRQTEAKLQEEGYFDPQGISDERERKLREIVQRSGAPEFRHRLILAYDGRCVITGCDAVCALDAAHITRYLGTESNHISNGLLLRSDIHRLFDLNYIGINPESLQVVVGQELQGSCYEEMDGRKLRLPENGTMTPSKEALCQRWEEFLGC